MVRQNSNSKTPKTYQPIHFHSTDRANLTLTINTTLTLTPSLTPTLSPNLILSLTIISTPTLRQNLILTLTLSLSLTLILNQTVILLLKCRWVQVDILTKHKHLACATVHGHYLLTYTYYLYGPFSKCLCVVK